MVARGTLYVFNRVILYILNRVITLKLAKSILRTWLLHSLLKTPAVSYMVFGSQEYLQSISEGFKSVVLLLDFKLIFIQKRNRKYLVIVLQVIAE